MKWTLLALLSIFLVTGAVLPEVPANAADRDYFFRLPRKHNQDKLKDTNYLEKRGLQPPGRRGRWAKYYEENYSYDRDAAAWWDDAGALPEDWQGPPVALAEEALNAQQAQVTGVQGSLQVPPLNWNGVVYVSGIDFATLVGAQAWWNTEDRAAVLQLPDGRAVTMPLGIPVMYVNLKPIPLPYPTVAVNDRIMLPLRAVAQGLGYAVAYDVATDVVTVIPDPPVTTTPTSGATDSAHSPG
jgi:hypothetical protein